MNIQFATSKMRKLCNNYKKLTKKYGLEQAKLIRRRLDEIFASENLAVLGSLPQARCHELKGILKGKLSVDIAQPYRLIFSPADNPIPLKKDGGLDWEKVRNVIVDKVEDPHG